MTEDLASALRGALKNGVNGVTIWPTQERTWQANVRVGSGWLVEIHRDPSVALAGALTRAGRMTAGQGAPETERAAPRQAVTSQGPQSPTPSRKPRTVIHVPASDPKPGGLFD